MKGQFETMEFPSNPLCLGLRSSSDGPQLYFDWPLDRDLFSKTFHFISQSSVCGHYFNWNNNIQSLEWQIVDNYFYALGTRESDSWPCDDQTRLLYNTVPSFTLLKLSALSLRFEKISAKGSIYEKNGVSLDISTNYGNILLEIFYNGEIRACIKNHSTLKSAIPSFGNFFEIYMGGAYYSTLSFSNKALIQRVLSQISPNTDFELKNGVLLKNGNILLYGNSQIPRIKSFGNENLCYCIYHIENVHDSIKETNQSKLKLTEIKTVKFDRLRSISDIVRVFPNDDMIIKIHSFGSRVLFRPSTGQFIESGPINEEVNFMGTYGSTWLLFPKDKVLEMLKNSINTTQVLYTIIVSYLFYF